MVVFCLVLEISSYQPFLPRNQVDDEVMKPSSQFMLEAEC